MSSVGGDVEALEASPEVQKVCHSTRDAAYLVWRARAVAEMDTNAAAPAAGGDTSPAGLEPAGRPETMALGFKVGVQCFEYRI